MPIAMNAIIIHTNMLPDISDRRHTFRINIRIFDWKNTCAIVGKNGHFLSHFHQLRAYGIRHVSNIKCFRCAKCHFQHRINFHHRFLDAYDACNLMKTEKHFEKHQNGATCNRYF